MGSGPQRRALIALTILSACGSTPTLAVMEPRVASSCGVGQRQQANGDCCCEEEPPPAYELPSRTIHRPGGCVPAADGLPGEPAPNADLLPVLLSHPWCWRELRYEFGRDGTLPNGGCWALSGDELLVGANDTWAAWPIRSDGTGHIAWRGMQWGDCAPPPPPPDPTAQPPEKLEAIGAL